MSDPTCIKINSTDLAPRLYVAPEVMVNLANEIASWPWVDDVEVGKGGSSITCTLTVDKATKRLIDALDRPRFTMRHGSDEPMTLIGLHLEPENRDQPAEE